MWGTHSLFSAFSRVGHSLSMKANWDWWKSLKCQKHMLMSSSLCQNSKYLTQTTSGSLLQHLKDCRRRMLLTWKSLLIQRYANGQLTGPEITLHTNPLPPYTYTPSGLSSALVTPLCLISPVPGPVFQSIPSSLVCWAMVPLLGSGLW